MKEGRHKKPLFFFVWGWVELVGCIKCLKILYQYKNSLIYSFLLLFFISGHFSFLPFPCVNILSIDRLITVSMLTLIKVTGWRVGRWRILRSGGISKCPGLWWTSANYNRLRLVLCTSDLRVLHSAWVPVHITTVTWNYKTIILGVKALLGIQAICGLRGTFK